MTHPSYALLAPAGRVSPQQSVAAQLAQMGENAGNLIFQYAVPKLLDGTAFHISSADNNYHLPQSLSGPGPLVFPAANHLRDADWSALCDFLEQQDRPLVVLGLGADRHPVPQLKSNKSLMRLIALLRERGLLVTTRGRRSSEFAQDLGLEGTLPLGCPSLLLNPARDLGQLIQRQLARPCAKLALHAADPFNLSDGIALGIENAFVTWCVEGHGRLWILPSGGAASCAAASGDLSALSPLAFHSLALTHCQGNEAAFAEVLQTKGLFPTDAQLWIARLRSCDLSIGTRAHGALAALAAGIPGILSPPDARCEELATTMHLPRIDRGDLLLAARHSSEEVRRRTIFDAARFDLWRGQVARSLARAFEKIGLAPSAHLVSLGHV